MCTSKVRENETTQSKTTGYRVQLFCHFEVKYDSLFITKVIINQMSARPSCLTMFSTGFHSLPIDIIPPKSVLYLFLVGHYDFVYYLHGFNQHIDSIKSVNLTLFHRNRLSDIGRHIGFLVFDPFNFLRV